MKASEFESEYGYDPDDLTTSEMPTHAEFGQYDQMRHVGPANPPQLQSVGFPHQVREMEMSHYHQTHLDSVAHNGQAEGLTVRQHHRPFQSRLQPPTIYHHHTSHPSHSSTLPAVPHHTLSHGGGGMAGGMGLAGAGGVAGVGGVAGGAGRGQLNTTKSTLPKLPTIIHGRSKTYAGRSNRVG